ncbi:hypothetical protein [Plasticicumulans sp.]|uniref:hypothetical protein n=1 Tax=Plasticicumulans sp. TaxID=2307179 RepID=UPI0032207EC8
MTTTYGPGFPDPAEIEAERLRKQRDGLQIFLADLDDARNNRPILTQRDPLADAFIQQMKSRPPTDPLARELLWLARRTTLIDGACISHAIHMRAIRYWLGKQGHARVAVWRTPINENHGGGEVSVTRYGSNGLMNIGYDFIGCGYGDGRQKFETAAAGADSYFELPF